MSNKVKYIIALAVILIVLLYISIPKFSVEELLITYPNNGTLFPPDIAPPTFKWDDRISGADLWEIMIDYVEVRVLQSL